MQLGVESTRARAQVVSPVQITILERATTAGIHAESSVPAEEKLKWAG